MANKSSETNPGKPVVSVADLARHLGLSDWTVSRAINGHPEVKAATRKRILEKIEEIGFRPNPLARGLRGKGTGLVGISFGELDSPVLVEKIASLERFLRMRQLRSVLAVTEYDKPSEMRALADFKQMRVEGMVLVDSTLTQEESTQLLRGVRWVFVDPRNPQMEQAVMVDRARGMSILAEHLISLGHKKFGLLGFSPGGRWRWPGLADTLECHRMNPNEVEAFEPEDSMKRSYAAGTQMAARVLAHPNPPTALIALNDLVAVGAIKYFKEHGVDVPGRFSVTGWDNLEVGHLLSPKLTTIDQQSQKLMEMAGEMLLSQLGETLPGAGKECRTVLPLFCPGESTGPVHQ